MDYEDFQARLENLGEMLEGTYTLIGKLCMRLPLPINLPPIPLDGDRGLLDGEGLAVAEVVERARVALLDLPMDDVTTAVFNTLLIEWLTTRELYALADFGPPHEYLPPSMLLALERMGRMVDYLEDRLDNPET
ncbi:hypothetical protein [Nonomuraea turcica]|uniref:hypothetical protein n=1 Tax=Nonomuraea sp. G32 TaxID=3067274 RepID=UPI00273C1158|nr:hypothetical protein [Nonomuraea sp. G32]MDP4510344.1 hypothetical protein [Nonomuraea sp. G32]